jgi:WD40 repeat protein
MGRTSNNEAPDFIIDNITFVVAEPPFIESDFNGDGAPDLVFEHQDGSLGVWFMNKGPDLISASYLDPSAVADPRWHIVGTGNFTETNKTDLLFQHEDGSLAVWLMDGTNLVSASLLNPSQPGEGWEVVGTGDMNHDGKKDILFQNTDGTLAVWFLDGITLVNGALLNPIKPGDSGWRVVGTAALTSAKSTDLILQHSDGTLAAWYMDGTNLVRGVLLNPSVPGQEGWRVASTLDLNGDGQTDLLFQHDDGTMAVWLMDGIDLLSGQLVNPEHPGFGWRVVGPR